jgi:hypothetical protein
MTTLANRKSVRKYVEKNRKKINRRSLEYYHKKKEVILSGRKQFKIQRGKTMQVKCDCGSVFDTIEELNVHNIDCEIATRKREKIYKRCQFPTYNQIINTKQI